LQNEYKHIENERSEMKDKLKRELNMKFDEYQGKFLNSNTFRLSQITK